jgi:hypothetical protein
LHRPIETDRPAPAQLDLGLATPPANPVLDELAGLDLDDLTPREALSKLAELQERMGR